MSLSINFHPPIPYEHIHLHHTRAVTINPSGRVHDAEIYTYTASVSVRRTVFCDRQAKLSVRAVTREETSAALLDSDLYDKNLARFDPKDAHAAVCREV